MIRKRITFGTWLAFCCLHIVAVHLLTAAVIGFAALLFPRFFFVLALLGPAVVFFLIFTPFFALAWNETYVDWHNSRIPPHYCQDCGYNLTGNVSGICPECGTRIDQP